MKGEFEDNTFCPGIVLNTKLGRVLVREYITMRVLLHAYRKERMGWGQSRVTCNYKWVGKCGVPAKTSKILFLRVKLD